MAQSHLPIQTWLSLELRLSHTLTMSRFPLPGFVQPAGMHLLTLADIWLLRFRPKVQGPMVTWTERAAAAVQLQDIALGFRLQLHAPHEYCMLYWWASSTICLQDPAMVQHADGCHICP